MDDPTKSNETFIRLFKLLELHGNENFMNEMRSPTDEFVKIYSCNQLIKTIGIALNNLNAPIVPMLTTHCEFILWRAERLDN